jgi:pimeloyl-ACP methyl ester carboxylesterase
MPEITVPGARIHYIESDLDAEVPISSRIPVVFVHGFCQSSKFWEPTLALLPHGSHRGFALDLKGFGESRAIVSSPPRTPTYGLDELADSVTAFADALGLETFVLVGNSMGGAVCQSLATRYPSRLQQLVLCGTGPYNNNPAAAHEKADMMEKMEWETSFFEGAVQGFFAPDNLPVDWKSLVSIAMGAERKAMVGNTRSSADSNFLVAIRDISVPTLIVQGELDASRTPVDGGRMNGAIVGSELHVLEGAGHSPMLERPDEFHKLFLDFLSRERAAL